MNKVEAKVRLKQLLDQGYLTHSLLLEIYEDDEEIPEYMWEFLVTDPRKEPSRQFTICTGAEGIKVFEKLFEEYEKNKSKYFILDAGPKLQQEIDNAAIEVAKKLKFK